MTASFAERLGAVDSVILAPLVRQVLADDRAELLDWSCRPLTGGMAQQQGASYGVYRFGGRARSQGDVRSWSLVLKATGAALAAPNTFAGVNPSDTYYWKREILAYQSGLLNDLPEGLTAVRCFGVVEHPDQEFWMWLEDVEDRTWSRADYGLAAYHLGQFNGAYLCGRPIPQAAWLSNGEVRTQLEWGEAGIADLQRLSRHPNNQGWLGGDTVARAQRLWAERERLLAALDRLPRTFCHHDAFRRNLMIRRNPAGELETVAVDWAVPGTGCIGEEMSSMVGASVWFLEFAAGEIKEYEAAMMAGYAAGLREAGWQGEPQLLRFGFVATTALHYGLGTTGAISSLMTNDERIRFAERFFGRPMDQIIAERAVFERYFLDLGDEALALLEKLQIAG